jgi:hypothetical protein
MVLASATLAASPRQMAQPACSEVDWARQSLLVVRLHLVDQAGMREDTRRELMKEAARIWKKSGVSVRWVADREVVLSDVVADAADIGEVHVRPAAIVEMLPRGMAQRDADIDRARDADDRSFESHEPAMTRNNGPAVAPPARNAMTQIDVIVTNGAPVLLAPSPNPPLGNIIFANGVPTPRITAYRREAERLMALARVDDKLLAERPARVREQVLGRVLGRAVAHELGHYLFASRGHATEGLMRASHRTDDLVAPYDQPFRVIAPRLESCVMTTVASGRGVE